MLIALLFPHLHWSENQNKTNEIQCQQIINHSNVHEHRQTLFLTITVCKLLTSLSAFLILLPRILSTIELLSSSMVSWNKSNTWLSYIVIGWSFQWREEYKFQQYLKNWVISQVVRVNNITLLAVEKSLVMRYHCNMNSCRDTYHSDSCRLFSKGFWFHILGVIIRQVQIHIIQVLLPLCITSRAPFLETEISNYHTNNTSVCLFKMS